MFYDRLVHFVFIWYIFSGLGITDQEISGVPGPHTEKLTFLMVVVATSSAATANSAAVFLLPAL
jgi:hypothetical protein